MSRFECNLFYVVSPCVCVICKVNLAYVGRYSKFRNIPHSRVLTPKNFITKPRTASIRNKTTPYPKKSLLPGCTNSHVISRHCTSLYQSKDNKPFPGVSDTKTSQTSFHQGKQIRSLDWLYKIYNTLAESSKTTWWKCIYNEGSSVGQRGLSGSQITLNEIRLATNGPKTTTDRSQKSLPLPWAVHGIKKRHRI